MDEQSNAISILSKNAFMDLFINKTVTIRKNQVSVGEYWFRHPKRREYLKGLVFDPSGNAAPEEYNLWKGFDVEASNARSCDAFLEHIKTIVCDNNSECSEYLLNWLAHIIQKPYQPPGVAVCLLSEQGAGKGLMMEYVGKILGRHYKQIVDKNQLLGQFTGQLEDAVLVFADELYWDGNRSETGLLKGLITEKTRMMERKYCEPIPIKNCVHLVIASNESWAIPAELGDRRFFVLEVSPARKGDNDYFSALSKEMSAGGPEALLDFLQRRDISSFVPEKFPKTAARVSQQLASLKPIDEWLYYIADAGALPTECQTNASTWTDKVNKHYLFTDYCHWHRKSRTSSRLENIAAFTQALNRFGISPCKMPKDAKDKRLPGYDFPSQADLRKNIDEVLGHPAPWENS
jgi:hypothetical protein